MEASPRMTYSSLFKLWPSEEGWGHNRESTFLMEIYGGGGGVRRINDRKTMTNHGDIQFM